MYVLLKVEGIPRCVTYFRGSRIQMCVTKCVTESKLVQNSVTYFMDGPLGYNVRDMTVCPLRCSKGRFVKMGQKIRLVPGP